MVINNQAFWLFISTHKKGNTMSYKKVGGLHFVKCSTFGFSFFITREGYERAKNTRDMLSCVGASLALHWLIMFTFNWKALSCSLSLILPKASSFRIMGILKISPTWRKKNCLPLLLLFACVRVLWISNILSQRGLVTVPLMKGYSFE